MMEVLLFIGAIVKSHSTITFSLVLYVLATLLYLHVFLNTCLTFYRQRYDVQDTDFIYSITAAIFGGTDLMVAALSADHGSISISVIYVLIFDILVYVSVFYIYYKISNKNCVCFTSFSVVTVSFTLICKLYCFQFL